MLPQALQRWQAVESVARTHFQRSGFGEIRTPVMEPTDLFCRGIGEATDVVGKEMYTFNDRGERSCTMRPEGTASVVRAALQEGVERGARRAELRRGGRRLAGRRLLAHRVCDRAPGHLLALGPSEPPARGADRGDHLGGAGAHGPRVVPHVLRGLRAAFLLLHAARTLITPPRTQAGLQRRPAPRLPLTGFGPRFITAGARHVPAPRHAHCPLRTAHRPPTTGHWPLTADC